jgi:hypothetical protein
MITNRRTRRVYYEEPNLSGGIEGIYYIIEYGLI